MTVLYRDRMFFFGSKEKNQTIGQNMVNRLRILLGQRLTDLTSFYVLAILYKIGIQTKI